MTLRIKGEIKGNRAVIVEINKDGVYRTMRTEYGRIARKYESTDRAKALAAFRRYRKELEA